MLNGLRGLHDDLLANNAPQEAWTLMREIIEICESDYRVTFGHNE
ncbi:hypothetical protein [Sphingomonas sp.]|nr:hypothetical protein [Sphingomonas sp.]